MKHQEHNHFSFPHPLELLPFILKGRVGVSFVCTSSRGIAVALLLAALPAWGGGVVTNCTEADLRAAMAGGGLVTFACDGIIYLSVTNATMPSEILIANDTVLDGTGRQITVTGLKRAFNVMSNATFTVLNLAIANSYGPHYDQPVPHAEPGAGILNDGGTLNLFAVSFLTNTAFIGGAIMNQNGGTVTATNCTFAGNFAGRNMLWANANGDAYGGAILNKHGRVNLQGCLFSGNRAVGGPGWGHVSGSPSDAYTGFGGAIHNEGLLSVNSCAFGQNLSTGGPGDSAPSWAYGSPGTRGGSGSGGAICNFGTLSISSSTFFSNNAAGGIPGNGMFGLASQFNPMPGGAGGAAGSGFGGALFNGGTASAVNSTFSGNLGVGVNGGQGGGGGSCDHCDGAAGGAGGNGGSGFGGICDTNGALRLTNCTIAFNFATAGNGGSGGSGGSGHLYPGPAGTNGLTGIAAGSLQTTGGLLINTLLAAGSPTNSQGTIADAGHNLSSDASCAFTNVGSLNSTDPMLGPIADNCGPTPTVALLPGSPAIDSGDTVAAPMTDQRGFPRPVGMAPDIGAYEYGSPALLQASLQAANRLDLLVLGVGGQTCRLLSSTDLWSWVPIATNQIGTNGTVHFSCDRSARRGFYRVVMP